MSLSTSPFVAALLGVVPRDDLLLPSDRLYDTARLVYNRMHDQHPAAIVRSLDPRVLANSVAVAASHGVELAVRGGGHHIGGFSTIDDGLLIDFSEFRGVRYDTILKMAIVEPGARLADLDGVLAAHGRCVPAGTVSDTGVAGLTLGGGIGWLVCGYGLACDHLRAATVLTSDGRLLDVSPTAHADLFSALRGGGVGAFGLVLELRFATIELPNIVAGSVRFVVGDTPRVLSALQQVQLEDPLRALSLAPILMHEGDHTILSLDLCCSDPTSPELNRIVDAVGGNWGDVVERPYTEWQKHFDDQFDPPQRGYWKSVHFDSYALDGDLVLSAIENAPSDGCTVMIEFYNHETLAAHADGSTYPLRDSRIGVLLAARWDDPREDERHSGWARTWATTLRLSGGGKAYSNYSALEDSGLRPAHDADTLALFDALERDYDPLGRYRRGHRSALARNRISS